MKYRFNDFEMLEFKYSYSCYLQTIEPDPSYATFIPIFVTASSNDEFLLVKRTRVNSKA